MTKEEAKQKGYELVIASAFEFGLIQNGRGLKTWWVQDFGGTMPDLDHPKIKEAILINEQINKGQL